MTTWKKQSETPLPFDTTLILTDGQNRLIALVEHKVNRWPDGSFHELFWIQPEGIFGCEWETEFNYTQITHWMLAPELPL